MSKKGEGAYQGKHWMQDPANKQKMLKMVAKMQKGSKAKRREAVAKRLATMARKGITTRSIKPKSTTLKVNGMTIRISKDMIEIDND